MFFLGKLPTSNNDDHHPIHNTLAKRPRRPFITIPPPTTAMESITPTLDDLSPSTTSFQSKLQLWENRSWNSNSPKEEAAGNDTKKTVGRRPAVFRETTTNGNGNQKNVLKPKENRFKDNSTPKEDLKKSSYPLRPVRPVLRETTNRVHNSNGSNNKCSNNNNKNVSLPWENRRGKSSSSQVQVQKPFQFRKTTNANPSANFNNKNVSTTFIPSKPQMTATVRNTTNKKSVLDRYNPTTTATFTNKARPVLPRRPTSKSGGSFQSSFAIFEDSPRTKNVASHKERGKELLRSLLTKLEMVRSQCKGNTGCLDIQGLCTPDKVETISDLSRCEWTAEQVDSIRVVLLPPDRQHIMDAIGRFLFGFQFHCRRRQLKPSFLEKLVQCLETLDRLYQLEMDKNPPLLFNILLGTTYHLYMELPKFQRSAFSKELSSMLAHLMQRWKDLLALHTLPQLKVDAEFSYPATQVLTTWLESIVSS